MVITRLVQQPCYLGSILPCYWQISWRIAPIHLVVGGGKCLGHSNQESLQVPHSPRWQPHCQQAEREGFCFLFLFWLRQVLVVALWFFWFGMWTLWFRPLDMWGLCSPTKDWTGVLCIARQIFNHCTSREVPGRESLNFIANRAGTMRGAKTGEVGNQLRLHWFVIDSVWLLACREWTETSQEERVEVDIYQAPTICQTIILGF